MPLATVNTSQIIPHMDDAALETVRRLENALRCTSQPAIKTSHVLHAGLYARTVRIPAGTVITGAHIKIGTLLIVNGDISVFVGSEKRELTGYNVMPASAGRKQAFLAHTDTDLTMLFPSQAKTIEQAEAEFTDETHLLLSRQQTECDTSTITGE